MAIEEAIKAEIAEKLHKPKPKTPSIISKLTGRNNGTNPDRQVIVTPNRPVPVAAAAEPIPPLATPTLPTSVVQHPLIVTESA